MDEDEVRLHLLQDRPHSGEDGGGNVKESLSLPHNGKVIVGDDLKNLQNLIQHLPVLPRDADGHPEACPALQLLHQRTHFNGLRTGAENEHNFFHGVPPPCAASAYERRAQKIRPCKQERIKRYRFSR